MQWKLVELQAFQNGLLEIEETIAELRKCYVRKEQFAELLVSLCSLRYLNGELVIEESNLTGVLSNSVLME